MKACLNKYLFSNALVRVPTNHLANSYIIQNSLALKVHINDPYYKRKSFMDIGGIFFWTATINNWNHLLKDESYKQVIFDSLTHLSERGLIDDMAH